MSLSRHCTPLDYKEDTCRIWTLQSAWFLSWSWDTNPILIFIHTHTNTHTDSWHLKRDWYTVHVFCNWNTFLDVLGAIKWKGKKRSVHPSSHGPSQHCTLYRILWRYKPTMISLLFECIKHINLFVCVLTAFLINCYKIIGLVWNKSICSVTLIMESVNRAKKPIHSDGVLWKWRSFR